MDARSLLRAKKAEARIEHPYASYSARGDLRCSVCAVPVKQWDAHILTKQHRTSVARERALAERATAKRAAEGESAAGGGKRQKVQAEDGVASSTRSTGTRVRSAGETAGAGSAGGVAGLPAGFFSAGNERRISAGEEEDDDDDANDDTEEDRLGDGELGASADTQRGRGSAAPPAPPEPEPSKPALPAKTGDADLDDFLASLAAPEPDTHPQSSAGPRRAPASAYSTSMSGGAGVASYEAAPVLNIAPPAGADATTAGAAGPRAAAGTGAGAGAGTEPEPEPEETEAERRARLAREEREEIMGRLEEEERAQEDADERVAALKARMEMIKQRREARGATKTKPKTTAAAKT